jgi:hypothetical protein
MVALGLVVIVAVAIPASAQPARPEPARQGFVTPTPGPDGKIIYIVQPGDDLWTIAALSGKSVEELMALNNMQPNDYLIPGVELLLGLGGPVLPTIAPDTRPTATRVPLTPTPVFGTGDICVILFEDVNGNAVLDEGELPLAGGQISVSELSGALAGEHTTGDAVTEDDTPEPYCFVGVANGDYNVSAAAPANYNPTTAMNVPVRVEPGDIKNIEFGAQASAALGLGGGSTGSRSTVLGAVGALLLLSAGALGYMAFRYNRRSPLGLR